MRSYGYNAPSESALLAEYEACQRDVNSNILTYWTLSGIFVGISSAFLAGLIYGILANKHLFEIVVQATTPSNAVAQRVAFGIAFVLGLAIIAMLWFMWCWVKRVDYVSYRHYDRMREIELNLGMWKQWRIHALDNWDGVRRRLGFKSMDKLSDKQINQVWEETLVKLGESLSAKSLEQLADNQEELFELCWRYPPQQWYQRPRRRFLYKCILVVMTSIWGLTILAALVRFIMTFLCIDH